MPEIHQHLFRGRVPDLPNARALGGLMDHLISALGMRTICPIITRVLYPEWGVFVMIAESHIHFWGVGEEAWGDVFSCKEFDAGSVATIVKEHLRGEWNYGQVVALDMEVVTASASKA